MLSCEEQVPGAGIFILEKFVEAKYFDKAEATVVMSRELLLTIS